MSKSVLVMCRTPLQAFIAKKLIQSENIEIFDVVYFTYEDNPRDRYYFNCLAEFSRESVYICSRYFKKEALNHFFVFYRHLKFRLSSDYNTLILSSIDVFLFRMIVIRYKESNLYTIDDGAANIYKNSSFYKVKRSRFSSFYEKVLGAFDILELKNRIKLHFSIYNGFDNIVECQKVKYLNPWGCIESLVSEGEVKIFVGQPFDELVSIGVLTGDQIFKVEKYLSDLNIDFYLSHPREVKFLNIGATLVSEQIKISEELIFDICGSRKPKIYSLFSSVILNISSSVADKFYISISNEAGEPERLSLVKKMGCKVVRL